ncbi:RDD family protein [Kitasatospora sp. LaBMicrA B282]|uniref:RDD family protein n=1 Tax=Kitasatospora sp. LaBMicrA B282 TaxID=3420949 RepID=UPI003D0C80E0
MAGSAGPVGEFGPAEGYGAVDGYPAGGGFGPALDYAGYPPAPPTLSAAPAAPAVARWRRGLAWLVDFALVLGLAVLLGVLTFHRIAALLVSIPGLAGESAWQLLQSHGNLVRAGEGVGRHLWQSAVSDVRQAFLALVLLTFLYQFAALLLARGRTLGKALLGLRVGTLPAPDGRSAGLRRGQAAIRGAVTAIADIGLFATACCLLVGGSFLLAAVCWAIAVAVFWCNAVPALLGGRRSLADRFAGTRVAPVALPDRFTRGRATP